MFSASGSANRIIDISGNGPSNSGGVLPAARQRVIAEGITINGLAITTSGQESHFPLGVYYEDCVIGGTGAFAMAADEPSLFKIAIRRKLVLEIAGPPARLIHADYRPADRAATDCSQVYKR
jgi:hypothetical protein